MKRILVTGGSGFIGTNLVQSFLEKGYHVLSIDITNPQCEEHSSVFRNVDILNETLRDIVSDFEPTHVVHLAARTDLHEKKDIKYYSVNTKGMENMVRAVSQQSTVVRCIFTSTKLVCRTGYMPKSDDDYCSNTLYGESKVVGEKIVRNDTSLNCDWCIVRPTSIWGPWFDVPYRAFFLSIAKGHYFHPGGADPPKSFGYVGNVVWQIERLLEAPREAIHKRTFYLSDYNEYTIREWANTIYTNLGNKKIFTIPEPVMRLAGWGGDLLQKLGCKNPPITSFRLRNMRTDTTTIPLYPIKTITGPLPYNMEQGVKHTIAWLRERQLIK